MMKSMPTYYESEEIVEFNLSNVDEILARVEEYNLYFCEIINFNSECSFPSLP